MSNRFPIDTSKYLVSDLDTAGAVHYFGFVMSNGPWYVMREDTTNNTYRYCVGSSISYAVAWAARTELAYTTFELAS